MAAIFQRFAGNPIVRPEDVRPSREDLVVACVLNPGAFRFKGRVGLLMRVAERPVQEDGWVSTPVIDPEGAGGLRILRIRRDDPDLNCTDPRGFTYKGRHYLTTLSHLRLAWSEDGAHFTADAAPAVIGAGSHESYGVEDCRVELLDGGFYLTYTAVSDLGVGVGLISTQDWKWFVRHGMIFPPHNKDCALFPERVGGRYCALHRPSGLGLGGSFMWLSRSPDLVHWGDHRCLLTTRPGQWDGERIGAGAAPIRTDAGWLAIYHGADAASRYCLGALLLDRLDPARVLARSSAPLFEPVADYERKGFFGDVVFTNGHVLDGDTLTIYYGASDSVICGARASVADILRSLA
jgi:predicted GH43/DUF377 family glycosyl hydrolase